MTNWAYLENQKGFEKKTQQKAGRKKGEETVRIVNCFPQSGFEFLKLIILSVELIVFVCLFVCFILFSLLQCDSFFIQC